MFPLGHSCFRIVPVSRKNAIFILLVTETVQLEKADPRDRIAYGIKTINTIRSEKRVTTVSLKKEEMRER
jgi:hypothetical protein